MRNSRGSSDGWDLALPSSYDARTNLLNAVANRFFWLVCGRHFRASSSRLLQRVQIAVKSIFAQRWAWALRIANWQKRRPETANPRL